MKIKDIIPIIKCKLSSTIRILDQDGHLLFSFYYCNIEGNLKNLMNKKVDHISIDIDSQRLSDTKIEVIPTLDIYIDNRKELSALDFIRNEFEKLFEDEKGINFWPSNKDHKVVLIVSDGPKYYTNGMYDLSAYDDMEDFTSCCRWAILEGLLKDLKYKTHRVDNDDKYILSVEVHHDNDE